METNKKTLGIVIGVIVVLGVISATIFLGKKSTDISTTDQNQTPPTETPKVPIQTPSDKPKVVQTPPPVTVPKKTTYIYKDGTYSATGVYFAHSGQQRIGVSITIKNDSVADISITPKPSDNTSARYQDMFIANYKQYVIGKNIADIYLSKISGASLTPIGFNDALAQIKLQAKA